MKVFAFDYFNTLDKHADVRDLARALLSNGHEVHVVSAISPGLPFDYEQALKSLGVVATKVHRVDHGPALKVAVLKEIGASAFWDDLPANVDAARLAGIPSCLVGVEPVGELRMIDPDLVQPVVRPNGPLSMEEQLRPLREVYPQYQIGEGSYGGLHLFEYGDTKITVGAYCSFGFGVNVLLGGEHRTEWVTTFPFSAMWPEAKRFEGHPKTRGDVVIGNDVWVGAGATILSGVTIGDGAVIAAQSLVVSSVPAYCVAGGNPARPLSFRFPLEVRERLQKTAWWNWPKERIVKALPALLDANIGAFLGAVEAGLL